MSGDVICCHNWEVRLASDGQRLGMRLRASRGPGSPGPKHPLTPRVSGAEAGSPGCRLLESLPAEESQPQ